MSEKILVLKFGGSSVGSIEKIKHVANICKTIKEKENCKVIAVVSAMGDTTDKLDSLLSEISKSPAARETDLVMSTGEQVSAALLAIALQELGEQSIALTGPQAGIITNNKHGKAQIEYIQTNAIERYLEQDYIPVITGYQGLSTDGEITTLGRGGSDTSAIALAVAFGAERCDIYTDVSAVCTTDPRIVSEASPLQSISHDEMLEMASLGAQVLHPRSVEIAKTHGAKMSVRSSSETDNPGTEIINRSELIEGQEAVRGVALDREQAALTVLDVPDQPGIASNIFCGLSDRDISVDLIIQSVSAEGHTEVNLTVSRPDTEKAETALQEIAQEIKAKGVIFNDKVVKVSIVGAGMIDQPGIASTMFRALGDAGININMISTSEIRISCIVAESDGEKAVQALHNAFELDKINS